jgi:amidohydrolase
MTDTDDLKERACTAIDNNRNEIIDLGQSIQDEPELGFKETRTTEKVASALDGLGLSVEENIAITGARARYGSGDSTVAAVLGELDALVNPEHPGADPETGACHACGHHAQITHLVGTAYGLVEAGIGDDLEGSVDFIAVPAEEYLDLGYRRRLLEEGEIEFFGGKQELIRRGEFNDIDMAVMMHAGSDIPDREITSDFSTNGFVGKFVTYTGREAHAGAAPEEGVNALNAAMVGMNGIHALREGFADEDAVRVHPIITKGGNGVNVVPSDVQMECYVRAKTVETMKQANRKVNRALEAGAMAIGADVEINDYPGYMPLRTDRTIVSAYDRNVSEMDEVETLTEGTPHLAGSTDMGDVTRLVPGIHPWVGGFGGSVHSREFRVVDEEMAYVIPAKITACTLIDVLTDEDKTDAIHREREAKMSTEEYLAEIRELRDDNIGSYLD